MAPTCAAAGRSSPTATICSSFSPGGWYGWPDVLDEQPTTEPRFSPRTATTRGVPQLLTSPTRADAIGAVTHFQKGVSADGLAFSTSDDFGWKNDAFVAEWGALGFGVQPPQGLPGFDVVHVHFAARERRSRRHAATASFSATASRARRRPTA